MSLQFAYNLEVVPDELTPAWRELTRRGAGLRKRVERALSAAGREWPAVVEAMRAVLR